MLRERQLFAKGGRVGECVREVVSDGLLWLAVIPCHCSEGGKGFESGCV